MFQVSRRLLIVLVMVVVVLAVFVLPAMAAATANGVALYAYADCERGHLDITLTTVGATREYGFATNAAGAILDEFEQATSLGDYDGTFVGYGINLIPAQPDGTIIGSYAYVGETPPSAADTAEFYVLYECDDESANTVLMTCFGPYGSCPKTAQEGLALLGGDDADDVAAEPVPGCDVLITIPANAVGATITAETPVYWQPGAVTAEVFPAGLNVRALGVDASGMYTKVVYACGYYWVPSNVIGPNFDAVWNGAPLPTDVVH